MGFQSFAPQILGDEFGQFFIVVNDEYAAGVRSGVHVGALH
jgi:hypothetical protein